MKRIFGFVSIVLLSGILLWAAAPPQVINYQGVLRNASSAPLSGTYDMAFLFYDLDARGTLLFTDTHAASAGAAVTVASGLFNVRLGGGILTPGAEPNMASVFTNHTDVWLEIVVSGETLAPRVRIASAAYAQNTAYAQDANTVDGKHSADLANASHVHHTDQITDGSLVPARGGTGLSTTGGNGNVLTSNGSSWVSQPLPSAESLGAVVDASDTSLTRTGSGIGGIPYKLKLNLGNANTWTADQMFGKVGIGTATPGFPLSFANTVGDKVALWGQSGATYGFGIQAGLLQIHTPTAGDNIAFGYGASGSFVEGLRITGDGKLGIGTTAPSASLDLLYAQPYHWLDELNYGARIRSIAWPDNVSILDTDHFYGLDSSVETANGGGIDAGYHRYLYGLRGSATATGSNWQYAQATGVLAEASGGIRPTGLVAKASTSVDDMPVGVDAEATGSGAASRAVGLMARASGGVVNWAATFPWGNVLVGDFLGIGLNSDTPPAFPLDIFSAQAVARLRSYNNVYGSVLTLNNTTPTPAYFGAVNFNDGAGQIAYTGSGAMAFKSLGDMAFTTNGFERMRLTAGGWLGIGLTPSYQLELLFDSAAKPGTNTWTVASDGRLKKDIAPFKDGLAIIEKINPISYRYNGLGGMPADMPCIGVLAQEIRNVAPYTVGTFRAKLNEKDEAATELYNFNSHALTFVMINAIKELDERTQSLVKDTGSPDGASKKSTSSADGKPSYAESGLLIRTTERAAQAHPSDVFQDELGNVYGRSFRPSLAEVATLMPSSEAIEAGDLLVADDLLPGQVRLAAVPADPRILGVATGEPGVCLNGRGPSEIGFTEPAAVPRVPVALSGIVLCKADASAGPIAVGDLLTTSATPGHAMRAANPAPGTVVGKALEPLASGTGLIKVLVMLR